MKTIIFGLGNAGKNCYHLLNTFSPSQQIIAFCDNNSELWATAFANLPIYSPKQLLTIEFDHVLIASHFHQEIYQQLTQTIGIDPKKISIAHSQMMHGQSVEFYPFLINSITKQHQQVFQSLHQGVQQLKQENITGDIAEFGCGSGQTALTIASAIQLLLPKNTVQFDLFDSFAGLPAPTSAIDCQHPHVIAGGWQAGNCYAIDDKLIGFLLEQQAFTNYQIYKGWFEQTLLTIPHHKRYAMIHLDCDFYLSTKQVLTHLFTQQLLQPGALLFFDDWNCSTEDKLGQRRAWQEITQEFQFSSQDLFDYSLVGHCKQFIDYSSLCSK